MSHGYIYFTALLLVTVVITGGLWTFILVRPQSPLSKYKRDIEAVHFGSLFLAPLLLGLRYAFKELEVSPENQMVLPLGMISLIFFSGVAYVFPKDPNRDRFYYWTKGLPLLITSLGIILLSLSLLWTAWLLCRPAYQL